MRDVPVQEESSNTVSSYEQIHIIVYVVMFFSTTAPSLTDIKVDPCLTRFIKLLFRNLIFKRQVSHVKVKYFAVKSYIVLITLAYRA